MNSNIVYVDEINYNEILFFNNDDLGNFFNFFFS